MIVTKLENVKHCCKIFTTLRFSPKNNVDLSIRRLTKGVVERSGEKKDKGRKEEEEDEERDCWLLAMPFQCDLPCK